MELNEFEIGKYYFIKIHGYSCLIEIFPGGEWFGGEKYLVAKERGKVGRPNSFKLRENIVGRWSIIPINKINLALYGYLKYAKKRKLV